MTPCRRWLQTELGWVAEPRMHAGQVLVTDNGNHILDCRVGALTHAARTEPALHALPGVVGTGLFLGMAHTILIQRGDSVEARQRSDA